MSPQPRLIRDGGRGVAVADDTLQRPAATRTFSRPTSAARIEFCSLGAADPPRQARLADKRDEPVTATGAVRTHPRIN